MVAAGSRDALFLIKQRASADQQIWIQAWCWADSVFVGSCRQCQSAPGLVGRRACPVPTHRARPPMWGSFLRTPPSSPDSKLSGLILISSVSRGRLGTKQGDSLLLVISWPSHADDRYCLPKGHGGCFPRAKARGLLSSPGGGSWGVRAAGP